MRLEDVIHVLKAVPLFRRIEAEALRLLAFSATRRQLRAGDVVFRRGDISDGGFLILSGDIVLDRADDGSPSPHVFGAGTLIGQMAMFVPVERPATAIARDQAVVLFFPRELMLRVLEAHPASATILRDAIAEDAKRLAEKLQNLPI